MFHLRAQSCNWNTGSVCTVLCDVWSGGEDLGTVLYYSAKSGASYVICRQSQGLLHCTSYSYPVPSLTTVPSSLSLLKVLFHDSPHGCNSCQCSAFSL
jgi:hypothetical protein